MSHLNFSLSNNFKILGSAHNIYEGRTKERQKVDEIFISSLFKRILIIWDYRIKTLSKITEKKIIPLGGISKDKIKLIKMLDCVGFAGITYFKKKGP